MFGTSLVEGVHLSRSLQQSNLAIPCLVWICIQFIETHGDGVKEVGIYRLSGSASIVQGLRNRFNAGLGNVKTGDLFSDDEPIDVHAVAGVLKAYIRECKFAVFKGGLCPTSNLRLNVLF